MSHKKTYTFIMDWNGGTYVSQFSGSDIDTLKLIWAESIACEMLKIQQDDKNNFILDVKSDTVVPLDGMVNVWTISPNIKGKMATVNIVETSTV